MAECCSDIHSVNCNEIVDVTYLRVVVSCMRNSSGGTINVDGLPQYPTKEQILKAVPTASTASSGNWDQNVDGVLISSSVDTNQLVRKSEITGYCTSFKSLVLTNNGNSNCPTPSAKNTCSSMIVDGGSVCGNDQGKCPNPGPPSPPPPPDCGTETTGRTWEDVTVPCTSASSVTARYKNYTAYTNSSCETVYSDWLESSMTISISCNDTGAQRTVRASNPKIIQQSGTNCCPCINEYRASANTSSISNLSNCGGSGSVTINVQTKCTTATTWSTCSDCTVEWSSSNCSWVTISNSTSKNPTFTVGSNDGTSSRSCSYTWVAKQSDGTQITSGSVSISQEAGPCPPPPCTYEYKASADSSGIDVGMCVEDTYSCTVTIEYKCTNEGDSAWQKYTGTDYSIEWDFGENSAEFTSISDVVLAPTITVEDNETDSERTDVLVWKVTFPDGTTSDGEFTITQEAGPCHEPDTGCTYEYSAATSTSKLEFENECSDALGLTVYTYRRCTGTTEWLPTDNVQIILESVTGDTEMVETFECDDCGKASRDGGTFHYMVTTTDNETSEEKTSKWVFNVTVKDTEADVATLELEVTQAAGPCTDTGCTYEYKIVPARDYLDGDLTATSQTLSVEACDTSSTASIVVLRKCTTAATWSEITDSMWKDDDYTFEFSESSMFSITKGSWTGTLNISFTEHTGTTESRSGETTVTLKVNGTAVATNSVKVTQSGQNDSCGGGGCERYDYEILIPSDDPNNDTTLHRSISYTADKCEESHVFDSKIWRRCGDPVGQWFEITKEVYDDLSSSNPTYSLSYSRSSESTGDFCSGSVGSGDGKHDISFSKNETTSERTDITVVALFVGDKRVAEYDMTVKQDAGLCTPTGCTYDYEIVQKNESPNNGNYHTSISAEVGKCDTSYTFDCSIWRKCSDEEEWEDITRDVYKSDSSYTLSYMKGGNSNTDFCTASKGSGQGQHVFSFGENDSGSDRQDEICVELHIGNDTTNGLAEYCMTLVQKTSSDNCNGECECCDSSSDINVSTTSITWSAGNNDSKVIEFSGDTCLYWVCAGTNDDDGNGNIFLNDYTNFEIDCSVLDNTQYGKKIQVKPKEANRNSTVSATLYIMPSLELGNNYCNGCEASVSLSAAATEPCDCKNIKTNPEDGKHITWDWDKDDWETVYISADTCMNLTCGDGEDIYLISDLNFELNCSGLTASDKHVKVRPKGKNESTKARTIPLVIGEEDHDCGGKIYIYLDQSGKTDSCSSATCENSLNVGPSQSTAFAESGGTNIKIGEYSAHTECAVSITAVTCDNDAVTSLTATTDGQITATLPDLSECGHSTSSVTYTITVKYEVGDSTCQKTFTITQSQNNDECPCDCDDNPISISASTDSLSCSGGTVTFTVGGGCS